jgi:hypothetical protein
MKDEIKTSEDIDALGAKLAFTIIESLLKSNESHSDLLAVMAHALDEDVAKALTNTPEWERYMDSRREMDATKARIEEFERILARLEGTE